MPVIPLYVVAVFIVVILFVPHKAYAYLDPGTGSIIIQVLIGVLVGGLVVIKNYWNKIKTLIRKSFSSGINDEKADD